ncbi:MAG: hypothetical protein H6666_07605 [Ardenticatenaceae bacterium]|nr:hypothetical protein [Ardenticatenaceae bacterium]
MRPLPDDEPDGGKPKDLERAWAKSHWPELANYGVTLPCGIPGRRSTL